MTDDEFEQAISRLVDNQISAEEFARLEDHLKNSAAARADFRKLAEVHSLLGRVAIQVTVPKRMPRRHRVPKVIVPESRSWNISLLAAAAVVALGLFVAYYVIPSWKTPLVAFQCVPGSKVTLDERGIVAKAGEMRVGSQMSLSQGVVKLTFPSGVNGIVRGPAKFQVSAKNQLRLVQGAGWFQVPAGARGFRVITHELNVTDLGTEFGVVAGEGSSGDEVHVFRGKVRAAPEGGAETELVAGKARRVEASGRSLATIPLDASLFCRRLPGTLPYLHWSFDDVTGGKVKVDGTSPAVGTVTAVAIQSDNRPAETRLVEGVRGRALSFDGKGDRIETNWPGIAGNKPRTVAMWVRYPEGALPRWDAGGVAWGARVTPNESVCWSFNFMASAPSADLHMKMPPKAVAFVTFNRWWRYGTTNIADRRWHCIATTYGGGLGSDGLPDARLYVDGQPERAQSVDNRRSDRHLPLKIDTRTDESRSKPLIFGSSQQRVDESDPIPYRYFAGEMDEVYVFEGVLEPDEIRRLSEQRQFVPGR